MKKIILLLFLGFAVLGCKKSKTATLEVTNNSGCSHSLHEGSNSQGATKGNIGVDQTKEFIISLDGSEEIKDFFFTVKPVICIEDIDEEHYRIDMYSGETSVLLIE